MTRTYHVSGESPTHFFECEAEVEVCINPNAEDPSDREYPIRRTYQFFEIILTSKKTGLSEETDELPDDILNLVKDAADEQFYE